MEGNYRQHGSKAATFTDEQLQNAVDEALELGKQVAGKGAVATYIPELGKARPEAVGLYIVTDDGRKFKAGDTGIHFTMQSVSKVISLAMALEVRGAEEVFKHVGMEPSGEAFNSIVELDFQRNMPYNPMINSGAITVESLIIDYKPFDDMLDFARKICMDPEITLNRQVYLSEMATCDRNRAIAYLLKSKGVITTNVDHSIELYTKMCSINVTAHSLANLGLLLANGGIDPLTKERLIKPETAKIIKTIMLTCGMYDGSGQYAVEVGIPTKSGVGGGLLAVAGTDMGIGSYGPALDEKGNSYAGKVMLKYLVDKLKLHIFD